MPRIRLEPEDRLKMMLDAGVRIADTYGIKALTRVNLAAEVGATDGLVNRYFGTRDKMRQSIITEAIKRKNARVVAWAIKQGFEPVGAPRQLKRDAAHVTLPA